MKKAPWILLGMLITAIPVTLAATLKFSDVPSDAYYYNAVNNLQTKGIVEGYGDGTYGPTNNLNRADMAMMLDRLINKINNGCVFIADDYIHGPDTNKFFLDGEEVYNVGGGAEVANCDNGEITITIVD